MKNHIVDILKEATEAFFNPDAHIDNLIDEIKSIRDSVVNQASEKIRENPTNEDDYNEKKNLILRLLGSKLMQGLSSYYDNMNTISERIMDAQVKRN